MWLCSPKGTVLTKEWLPTQCLWARHVSLSPPTWLIHVLQRAGFLLPSGSQHHYISAQSSRKTSVPYQLVVTPYHTLSSGLSKTLWWRVASTFTAALSSVQAKLQYDSVYFYLSKLQQCSLMKINLPFTMVFWINFPLCDIFPVSLGFFLRMWGKGVCSIYLEKPPWGRYYLWLSRHAALGNTGCSTVSSCFLQREASKPRSTSGNIFQMTSVLFCYGKCEHLQK